MKRTRLKNKSSKKRLDDIVQAAARAMVIARDGKCVVCGRSEGVILQCGHLISRRKASVRWDERNLYCQCRDCNGDHRFNAGPLWFYARNLWGKEAIEGLIEDAKHPKPEGWKLHECEEKEAEFYRKARFYELSQAF